MKILFLAIMMITAIGCGNNEPAVPRTEPATGQTEVAPATKTDNEPATGSASTTTIAAAYTCPMHPEVVSDKPDKCPKCGMNLVLKK